MKEPTQKQRANDFVSEAVMWKWKRAAQQVNDFELFGNLAKIKEEVFIVNGTSDLIHDQRDYPKIAEETPKGRFLYLETDESNRERLMGVVAKHFTSISAEEGLPPSLIPYEKEINRF